MPRDENGNPMSLRAMVAGALIVVGALGGGGFAGFEISELTRRVDKNETEVGELGDELDAKHVETLDRINREMDGLRDELLRAIAAAETRLRDGQTQGDTEINRRLDGMEGRLNRIVEIRHQLLPTERGR